MDVFVLVFLAGQLCVGAVQITSLRVPAAVRNGSGTAAVLDCEYSLRPEELSAHSGLVVKWFFNNGPAPVYQWIPSQKPQDLGILKGRLKLDYRASHHVATMHRALYILNPTTELSGEYKCFVSTFGDEDFMIKRMVVFAPEKRLEVVQSKPALESVNISCLAQGVYPEPKMALYKDPDRQEKVPLQGVVVETSARAGQYDISATALLHDEDLDTPTVFYCELRIPDTTYAKRKSIVYYPGSMASYSSVSDYAERKWRTDVAAMLFLLTTVALCS